MWKFTVWLVVGTRGLMLKFHQSLAREGPKCRGRRAGGRTPRGGWGARTGEEGGAGGREGGGRGKGGLSPRLGEEWAPVSSRQDAPAGAPAALAAGAMTACDRGAIEEE